MPMNRFVEIDMQGLNSSVLMKTESYEQSGDQVKRNIKRYEQINIHRG